MNYSKKYNEYDFRKHLLNYNIRPSQDVFKYNEIKKTNNEEFSYKYKKDDLIEIINYDSPNIIYSKTVIKKLKNFSYNKTLDKANKLYLTEKNSR